MNSDGHDSNDDIIEYANIPTTPITQNEDLEIFRIFFELFDHEKNGFIAMRDLYTIL